LGKERYAFEEIAMRDDQVTKITIYKKNEEYMRGFKIDFQSGDPLLVGSADGISVGMINF